MTIDTKSILSSVLAGLVLAGLLGLAGIYRQGIRHEVLLQQIQRDVAEIKVSSHTHGGDTRMYLPDAAPE